MTGIITSRSAKYNTNSSFLTHFSEIAPSANSKIIERLPKTQYLILCLALEYHDACRPFCLGNAEIGRRFGVNETTASRHVADLKRHGFMDFDDCGQNVDILRITLKGIDWLVDKAATKLTTQSSHIPYYDLSKKEETNILKILSEEENQIKYEEPIEKVIETFLNHPQVSFREKEAIKHDLKASRIGPVRTEGVLRRMVNRLKKGPIERIRAYLRACFLNEEKKLKALKEMFAGCRLKSTTMYSTDYFMEAFV